MKNRFFGLSLIAIAVTVLPAGTALAVCERPVPHRVIFQASTKIDVPSQVLLAENVEELKKILVRLGFGPFDRDRTLDRFRFKANSIDFLVVIGAPRNNGCRRTEFLCAQQGDRLGIVEAVVAEIAPGCGCTCTQNMQGSAVFVVTVPERTRSVELLSLHRRHDCRDCDPGCSILTPGTTQPNGEVVFGQSCP